MPARYKLYLVAQFVGLASRLRQSFSIGLFSERMSQAECLCKAEKRMKVSGSQIAKLKSFQRLTKEVATTRDN